LFSLINFIDITRIVSYIARGVELDQSRLISRAIRQNITIRKDVTGALLKKAVTKYIPDENISYKLMIDAIDVLPMILEEPEIESTTNNSGMDLDTSGADIQPMPTTVLPEVEIYILTLTLTTLLRENLIAAALTLAHLGLQRLKTFNRRTLDQIASKFYFYYSLTYERLTPAVTTTANFASARPELMNAYRRASVRRDEMSQAVLLNLLMRNFLHFNLYQQAETLATKATFPEQASNNQLCRYLYYTGRIAAIQLEYSEAHMKLLQASRKAPTDTATAFMADVTRLSVLVQLLMGDIPPASTFRTDLRGVLMPYEALTIAVKNGDIEVFGQVAAQYASEFKSQKNFSLVQRLQHNVLKTGLRKLTLAYARISLSDIATKLHLSSLQSTEYICAKAIRDGVIEATIDHDNGWLISSEGTDDYASEEPTKAFHRRIAFLMDVHNEAVKSMRYPPDAYKKAIANTKNKDGDVEKSIEELIQEMEDDMDDL